MKTFIFHAGTINGDSNTENALSTHTDYLVILQHKLTKMGAVDGVLKLYFDDAKNDEGLTNGASSTLAFGKVEVSLTVANASIPAAAERIATLMNKSKDAFIKFDSVNSVFDVEQVTGVSILNTSATTTPA